MDEDRGQGNPKRFPAEELERLYREGGMTGGMRIRGDALNKVLNVKTYVAKAWYVVTDDGVQKL